MRRRDFLAASCAAGLAPLAKAAAAAAPAAAPGAGAPKDKDYFELRLYLIETAEQRKTMDAFLGDVMIPALNRLGVKPVAVFQKDGAQDLYVLMPHKTAESALTAELRLLADAEFLKAGAAALDAPKSAPAFKRIESSILLAFDSVPRLETPVKNDGRIFQLRIYESHSAVKGVKKVQMFNEGGEVAVFRRCGMNPVFFGQTIVGTKVPNLTYMLGFEGAEAQKAAWAKFMADPDWKKLSGDPQYKDTVSNITNMVLRPTAYSQV